MLVRIHTTLAVALLLAAWDLTWADEPQSACRRALLEQRVQPGSFPDELLFTVISAEAPPLANEATRERIQQLFDQLGSPTFTARNRASQELRETCYNPPFLEQLLAHTDDPEIRVRAREVLTFWGDHPPAEETPARRAERRLKMWYNLPPGPAKMRSFPTMAELARSHDLDYQALHDDLRGLPIATLPPAQRRDLLLSCFQVLTTDALPCQHLLAELSDAEWRDPRIQEGLQALLASEAKGLDSGFMKELLYRLPDDIDLAAWLPLLGRVPSRDGIIAAILVKNGVREALPPFLVALNTQWDNVSTDKGRVNGGGHSQFYSFFYQFEELGLPGFRPVAADILAGIAPRLAPGDAAVQSAYFTIVRTLAETPAGVAMLKQLADHDTPQVAIAACALLISQGHIGYTDALAGAMAQDEAYGLLTNLDDIYQALRHLRTIVFLDEPGAKEARDAIGKIMVPLLNATAKDAQLATKLESLGSFVSAELQPFGLWPDIRDVFSKATLNYESLSQWDDLDSVFAALVADARQHGDDDAFLAQVRERAMRPEASQPERLVYTGLALAAGLPAAEALAPVPDLAALISDEHCPPLLLRAAWIVNPPLVLREGDPKEFRYRFNILTFNPEAVHIPAVETHLGKAENPAILDLFRHAYGLQDGPLGITADLVTTACRMRPRQPLNETQVNAFVRALCTAVTPVSSRHESASLGSGLPLFLERHAPTFDLTSVDLPPIRAARAQQALIRGDLATHEQLVDRAFLEPGIPVPYWLRHERDAAAFALNLLARGQEAFPAARTMHFNGTFNEAYRLPLLLAGKGHYDDALTFLRRVPPPSRWNAWESAYCDLHRGLILLRTGDWEAARKFFRDSVTKARFVAIANYGRMMLNLMADDSEGLTSYAAILRLRQDPGNAYREKLTSFARATTSPDLKALASFQAGRIAANNNDQAEARQLWELGAATNGLYASLCRDMIDAIPNADSQFHPSPSWDDPGPMEAVFSPFDFGFGICFRGRVNELMVNDVLWLDPYGIPANQAKPRRYYHGSGWWLYIRESARRWVPGEWSILVHHQLGVEHHQRRLQSWPPH